MLFYLLKSYARLALRIYCRRVVINKPELLQIKGPVLFAANHPNSFLDGIILTTLLEEHLYSLARGDAFTPRWNKWLRRIHLLPVYRTSEGTENLAHNYTTFASCHEVFAKNGVVLIFSEGACVNEWRLRPLRKGTARLATSAWEKGIDLQVIPLAFNYSSFRSFGKNVYLLFGEPLDKTAVTIHAQEGKQLSAFNRQLHQQLAQLVYPIASADKASLRQYFSVPLPAWKRVVLPLPAFLGWLLHTPLFYPVNWLAARFDPDHYDSVVVAALLLLYPLYLAVWVGLAAAHLGVYAAGLLLLLPFCAWACVQLKPQVKP